MGAETTLRESALRIKRRILGINTPLTRPLELGRHEVRSIDLYMAIVDGAIGDNRMELFQSDVNGNVYFKRGWESWKSVEPANVQGVAALVKVGLVYKAPR